MCLSDDRCDQLQLQRFCAVSTCNLLSKEQVHKARQTHWYKNKEAQTAD